MKNKLTSIGMVCLIVTMGFLGFITFKSNVVSAGNVWYVGSGAGNHSTTIQGGINLAGDGDTVFVYSGYYVEILFINKTLNLTGEDMQTTIIEGVSWSWCIMLTANWTNITGFAITDSAVGIYFPTTLNNITIENNIISDNGVGIYLNLSVDNTINNNNITNNYNGIIIYQSSNNNTITYNNISSNSNGGIHVNSSSVDNIIYQNRFIDNVNQAYDDTNNGNHWDNGYPSGGNYWSDYDGIDLNSTPTQDVPPSDGIGDTPYIIDADSKDNYPLTEPTIMAPSKPRNLQASSGDSYVNITWEASILNGSSFITNYRIYRGAISGGETFLIEIGNILYYNDTNKINGFIYYYKVSAKNMDGEGPLSNEAIAIPLGLPSKTQNLQASAGDSYVNISWSAPASNGGSPITNYTIYKGTSSGAERFLTEIGNLLYYNDTNATNGITYFYKVSAKNVVGQGGLSNEANATPVAIPMAPQNLQAYAGIGYVNLTWNASFDNNSFSITNYIIYKGTTSSGETLLAEIGNVRFYNDTTVINGIKFYYKVSAKNAAGEGPLSNEVNATPYLPVNQPPTCTIFYPNPGITISGKIEVNGTSFDIDGAVQRNEIKIDEGNWIWATGTTTWNYILDTTDLTNGQHTIYVRSYDGSNYSSETSISVEIDNPVAEEPEDLWWLWFLIAIIIILLLMVALLALRKKKPVEKEVEEEPEDEEIPPPPPKKAIITEVLKEEEVQEFPPPPKKAKLRKEPSDEETDRLDLPKPDEEF